MNIIETILTSDLTKILTAGVATLSAYLAAKGYITGSIDISWVAPLSASVVAVVFGIASAILAKWSNKVQQAKGVENYKTMLKELKK